MCLSRDAIKAYVQRHCDGNEVDDKVSNVCNLFINCKFKSKSYIIAAIIDAQIRPPAIETIVFSEERYQVPEQLLCFDHDEDLAEEEAEPADEEEDGVTSLDVLNEFARMVRDGLRMYFACIFCVLIFMYV